jgi:predicted regulator of Ras-like GTPase activity (Roadblock/LC7/MglB family)
MDTILTEINAVTGVQGSFFCDKQGEVLASAAPDSLDAAALQGIGRQVALILIALDTAGETISELDFTYEGARLVTHVLLNAVLVVLCEPQVEIALLRMTLDLPPKT